MLGCAAFSACSIRRLETSTNAAFDSALPCVSVASFESHQQPLDLSVPKWKVRQHWSGGSIVEEGDADSILDDPCTCKSSSSTTSSNQSPLTWFRPRIEIHVSHSFYPAASSGFFCPSQVQVIPQVPSLVPAPVAPPHTRPLSSVPGLTTANPGLTSSVPGLVAATYPGPQLQPTRSLETSSAALQKRAQLKKVIGEKAHERITVYVRSRLRSPTAVAGGGDHVMEDDFSRLAATLQYLQNSGYYYSALSWQESVTLLQGTEVGTFLIRDSADPRFLFSLSVQTERGAASVRIHYDDGSFRLDADVRLSTVVPRFDSVSAMIDYYVAQWKHVRDKGQVWLDGSGRMYSDVVLRKPFLRKCHSLQHLCRLSWNKTLLEQRNRWKSSGLLPLTVHDYLSAYPFQN